MNNVKIQNTRRDFLKTAGMGSVVLLTSNLLGFRKKKEHKTNIILIMSDDVSPDLYGCYGNKKVKTPNLDKMAKEGVMFNTAWATAMCAPTRVQIMTGRYAPKTGVYRNEMWLNGSDVFANNHTFSKLVKKAGYETAIAGKWHCGSISPYEKEVGFDEYCLWESLREINKLHDKKEYKGGYENEVTTSRYWHPGIIQNHKLLETKPDDFGPEIFTNFLCDFMERKKDEPFLAYFPMVSPHGTRNGITTTPEKGEVGEMGKTKNKKEADARFEALNEYIDLMVGKLWTKVVELGIDNNTILIYTSDNGTGNTAKTRGVERGCRVPFIAYGAGIKKRGATDELTDLSDILPTLVDYAGGKLSGGYEVDGKSLKPFLSGKSEKHREWIYSNIATTQLVRTKDYMIEAVDHVLENPNGRLLNCKDGYTTREYKNISDSKNPNDIKARQELQKILKNFPPIMIDHPFFKTKKGRKFFTQYVTPKSRKKQLHNHVDFQYYDE